jgi:hypothetical protein
MQILETPAELRFDEQTHTYWIGQTRVPGVTEILKHFFGNGRLYAEEDAWRGQAVHRAVHLFEKGTLDEQTLDETVAGYLEAYKKAKADLGFRVLGSEMRVFNGPGFYAGTLDLLVELAWNSKTEPRTFVIDIKTGKHQGWHVFQTALYANCFAQVTGTGILELSQDGTFDFFQDCEFWFSRSLAITLPPLYLWKLNAGLIKKELV